MRTQIIKLSVLFQIIIALNTVSGTPQKQDADTPELLDSMHIDQNEFFQRIKEKQNYSIPGTDKIIFLEIMN
jgi:hypothetical protein